MMLPTFASLVALVGGLQPGTQVDPVEYFLKYEKARKAYSSREYEAALPHYKLLNKWNSADPDLEYRYAVCLYLTGQQKKGAGIIAHAVESGYGDRGGMSYTLAQVYAGLEDKQSALKWLGAAVESGFGNRAGVAGSRAFEAMKDDAEFMSLAGLLPSEELSREEQWAYDLDFYLEEVMRMHADPDSPGRTEQFRSRIEQLKGSVGSLTDEQVRMRLQEINVGLGDGHTYMKFNIGERFDFAVLPLKFHFFPDGMYILEADEVNTELIGAKVEAINGRLTDGLLKDLEAIVHRDNAQTVKWLGVRYARSRMALKHLGYQDDADQAELQLKMPNGSIVTKSIDYGSHDFDWKMSSSKANNTGDTPLYLQNVKENYGTRSISDDVFYFQFNQVANTEGESIAQFASRLQAELRGAASRYLVVDVRHNNGGNNTLLAPLLRILTWFETDSADNRVFVITSRNTYSACQNFINRVEQILERPVFAGEPSSSSPNFVGEETSVRLPFSGVEFSISNRYWQDSDSSDRRQFIPMTVPVELTARDYFANRDPVMDALMRLFEELP